jgi:tetratricopeptide (TPR) repeat protein
MGLDTKGEGMISWVAMDRIVERQRASDAKYRQQTEGRPLRSGAKRLSDEGLVAKLHSFGIEMDRPRLDRLSDEALSAEEIAKPLLEQRAFKNRHQNLERDWIWICLGALWQRWFPSKPSFELLDDKMQAGYDLLASSGSVAACRIWLEAWGDVLHLLDKASMRSIEEFDDRFGGTQSLFNWMQDLETELWNAGLEERQFLTARIALCEEALRRFRSDDELTTENWRRALAGSYFELGETTKAEALYRDWLKADPGWGWGWIGWSDCYRFTRTKSQDLTRCEQILREGLSIADVRDRPDLADRLADLCEEQGRKQEAEDWWPQAQESEPTIEATLEALSDGSVLRQKTRIKFGEEGCRSVSCPTSAPRSGRIPRQPPSSSKRSGETSHAHAGAARNSRNVAAGVRQIADRLLRIVAS